MRRCIILLLLVPLFCGIAKAGEASTLTLYLQLVRGSNATNPPTPEAKLIGPKLSARLHGIFEWTNYWEIKRDSVVLKSGDKTRKRMSAEREVEIELLNTHEMTVRTYCGGKTVCESRQSLENRFFITGGDKEGGQSWFIVMRRDPPPNYGP